MFNSNNNGIEDMAAVSSYTKAKKSIDTECKEMLYDLQKNINFRFWQIFAQIVRLQIGFFLLQAAHQKGKQHFIQHRNDLYCDRNRAFYIEGQKEKQNQMDVDSIQLWCRMNIPIRQTLDIYVSCLIEIYAQTWDEQ